MIRYGYQMRNQYDNLKGIVHERGYGASDLIAEDGVLVQVRIAI